MLLLFFCGRKFAFSFFLLFIVFPSEYFFFFVAFFTFVQNYFLFSLNINERSWYVGLVSSKAKAGLKNVDNVLCSTYMLSLFGICSRESFSPRELSRSSLCTLTNTSKCYSPHFYDSLRIKKEEDILA